MKNALVILLLASLSACRFLPGAEDLETSIDAQTVQTGPRIDFDDVRSRDPQSSIGAREHPRILKANGGAYRDEKLEALLALITGELVVHSNDPEKAFDVTILDSPSVNAFALPGGYLYVTRGLLALANDMSEVAAVLAHEMAHVSANHGVQRRDRVKANDIADRVLSEVVTNPIAGKVVQATTRQRLAAFSQRQELQADAISIKTIGRAGYDPFAAVRFLESMDRYAVWRDATRSEGPDISSSHPSTPRRIELARGHARFVGPPGTGEKKRPRFLEGIDGMLFGDAASEGYVRGNRFSHRKLGITFNVPDAYNLTNRADAVLASGPGQSALRFDAVLKTADNGATPQDYLKSGWVNGLETASVTVGSRGGMPSASGVAQAGDWKFAIEVVEFKGRYFRFILAAPRDSTGLDRRLTTIAATFRALTARETAQLKPLRIRLVKVKVGDTPASLAQRMTGVARKRELFAALNALNGGGGLTPGQMVKIVSDR